MPDLGLSGGAMPNGQVLDTAPPAPSTPPPTNPTAPTPYNTPIPGVAQYSQLIALAQNYYKQSVATLNLKRQNLLQTYGYTAQIDPATGLVKNMSIDVHNPYGLYQQTLKGGGQQMDATRSAFAARGIRGGLEHQAETANKYEFGKATNQLTQGLQSSLLDLQTQQEQAKYQEQNSIVQAQLQALQQAIAMMLSGQNIDPANLAGIQLPQPS